MLYPRDVARPRSRPRPVLRAPLVVIAVVVVSITVGLAPAGANSAGPPQPWVEGLAGPLSIDVTHRGDVLVGQNFAGVVSLVTKGGKVKDLVAEEGASAVASGAFGVVVYSVRTEDGTSLLKVRMPWGSTKVLADLGAYEAATNPDTKNTYGIAGLSPDCAAKWPVDDLGPVTYDGQVDSNPYALALTYHGVYVADAGANAIFLVDWKGRVKTVAVLPPQPTVLDDPGALGLDPCFKGATYGFEPVPTDIELARSSGYVSLLPGGPEDPSLGARGSVVKVDLHSGSWTPVASGLFAATDLAVSPSGDVYVAELFGGRISKVTPSGLRTVVELPEPAAVEWAKGRLYVAYDAFGSGKVATVHP